MNFQEAIERIYAYLEADKVEQAVMACVRLARTSNDHLNASIFLRELYPDKNEVARALLDDTAHLKREAQKFILEKSLDRWIELHTIDDADQFIVNQTHLPAGERKNIFKVAAGDIGFELEQLEKIIVDISTENRPFMRLRMKALHSLKTKIKTRCLNYAIQIERQFGMQKQTESILWNAQNEVHNYFNRLLKKRDLN